MPSTNATNKLKQASRLTRTDCGPSSVRVLKLETGVSPFKTGDGPTRDASLFISSPLFEIVEDVLLYIYMYVYLLLLPSNLGNTRVKYAIFAVRIDSERVKREFGEFVKR